MDSYIILGHGSEEFGVHRPVPAGCVLVLTEECGMLGTLPWQLYPIFSNPENKRFFDDPISHKADIERLLGKPIEVLVEGQPYPGVEYTLLSYNTPDKASTAEPSGVYKLPSPNFIYHPERRGRMRHAVFRDEIQKAFAGSVFPKNLKFGKKSLYEIADLSGVKITQERLFQTNPGIYYNLLCRTVKSEKAQVSELIKAFDSRLNVDAITDSFDFFGSVKHWLSRIDVSLLSSEKRSILTQISTIVDKVFAKRRPRGNNVEESFYAMLNSSVKPSLSTIKSLLESQPDLVNKHERRAGRTLLMAAASMGYNYIIELLLKKGADINAKDIDEETPLFYAARTGQNRTMRLLLDKGADPKVGPVGGPSLLHYIADDDESVDLLDDLMKRGVLPNLRDDSDNTALHLAVENKARKMIVQLLRVGVDPNLTNMDGLTPLMEAIEELDYQTFKLLVGVTDLKIRNPKGTSAFGLALKMNHDIMCIDLIKAGAESDWTKVLGIAESRDMTKLAEYIRQTKLRAGGSKRKTRRMRRNNKDNKDSKDNKN
jgi:ankyrin repeat protein